MNAKKGAVISVLNPETGNITAFFNEFPGLLVQGNSSEDVKDKLKAVLEYYIKHLESLGNDIHIETETIA